MKKIKAIGENILIQKIEESTTSWIILWTDQDAPTRWTVLDIGSLVGANGKDIGVQVGDTVFFSKHAADMIYIDGEKLYLVKSFSILAKE